MGGRRPWFWSRDRVSQKLTVEELKHLSRLSESIYGEHLINWDLGWSGA